MSDSLCVDASVAAKWILSETDSHIANRLLDECIASGTRLMAPPHFVTEVTSAVYRQLRLGNIAPDAAKAGMRVFESLPIATVHPPHIAETAINLALEFAWKYPYDAFYLALGELIDCDVWTADGDFHRDAHAAYPRLRLLSELAS